jgi:hypothetical protein
MGPPEMIGDTTSECDGVSTTAVQSSSAAIDRGTGGVEGVGIMEVCRGGMYIMQEVFGMAASSESVWKNATWA